VPDIVQRSAKPEAYRTIEKRWNSMKNCKDMLLLYAVTDSAWVGEKSLYEQVEAALKGGVTCVQLREKKANEDEFMQMAVQLRKLCNNYKVPFIVNDNVSVAIACKADGVHVGQKDRKAGDVRKMIGKDMILGVTAHNLEEAQDAKAQGADYLGVGAAFSTSTKEDAKVLSHEVYKQITQSINIPIVAIGGISKKNIMELASCGVDGVALVSAIFAAKDIENECRELYQLVSRMTKT